MKKIVIIGGGIAGLAAAYRIQREIDESQASIECVLLEGANRLGGKIRTERFDGFIVEGGPDSFISQKPWAIELCKQLGIGDRLVGTNPDQTSTYVYTGKKLCPMPDGLSLMIPTRFLPFITSPLFSLAGKLRMGMDLLAPKKADDSDESLASFTRRRLGEECLKKMAEPMLAGIYAADPEKMSIKATFPMFFQTEQKHRSLILGMLARKRMAPVKTNSYSLFMTLKNGLGEMVETLVEKSPAVSFRTAVKVDAVMRNANGEGRGWRVMLADGGDLEADVVILAPPANIAAQLLRDTAPQITKLLSQIHYVSTATITLAYRKDGFSHPLNGFGFVVPTAEKRSIMACTWTSTKFPQRAPSDFVLLRCFVGGALREELAERNAESIAALVQDDLRDIMGIRQKPVFCRVYGNRKANVQYHVGHETLIGKVGRELQNHPGLYLAGSAYTGIGLPDCILNGTRAAESALAGCKQI
ncbi:MAG: protoporphyrinogen oxidase [Nitrospinales bacterium]